MGVGVNLSRVKRPVRAQSDVGTMVLDGAKRVECVRFTAAFRTG